MRYLSKAVLQIAKVVDGVDLTALESEEVFTDIFLKDKDGFHFVALCAALHAKGETSDELLGLCRSTAALSKRLKLKSDVNKITDLSGTGGGRLKTINVSTLASFIVAAAGYTVAKQSYFRVTSPTGSADVFKAFGIDVFDLSIGDVKSTLNRIGICPFFIPAMSPLLKNRGMLSKKIFIEKKIRIKTPFHLVSFATPPTKMFARIYGCYTKKYLNILGELFFKLGYKRTLVVYGVDGLPEVSNIGKTRIVEQTGKKLKSYHLNPHDFGLRKANIKEIETGGREANIIDFIKILYGREKGAKLDLALANAGASFYVLGEVGNFLEGTTLARRIVKEGLAWKKMEQLIEAVGDSAQLEFWKRRAGLI